jgi:hypothetical protein
LPPPNHPIRQRHVMLDPETRKRLEAEAERLEKRAARLHENSAQLMRTRYPASAKRYSRGAEVAAQQAADLRALLAHASELEAENAAGRTALERSNREREHELGAAIDERDAAQEAISQAYYLIVGRSPEWSNLFGYEQALADIEDAQSILREVGKTALGRVP